jgi:hypothetical protein
MSKQSESKVKQGYRPIPKTCSNCAHFTSKLTTLGEVYGGYSKESHLRCSVGGFKVKKMGTCNEWRKKI